jgi:hypothetical protein
MQERNKGMKTLDKEKAISTLIRDLELEHRTGFVEEVEVIHAGLVRGLRDPAAIIDELVTVGVLYRPTSGLLSRVEK